MKLELDIILNDPTGDQPLKIVDQSTGTPSTTTLAEQISVILASAQGLDAHKTIKFYQFSGSLMKDGTLECDEADRKLIYETVEKSPRLPVSIKAPLLNALEAKE